MGRSYTPRYVVQIVETSPPPGNRNFWHTPASWNVKSRTNVAGYGNPTDKNLEKFISKYGDSLKPGGINQHLSLSHGYIPYPSSAFIKDQTTGEIVATWKAAMFQIWN